MKTRDDKIAGVSLWRLLKQSPADDEVRDFRIVTGKMPVAPVAVDKSGHRLGWIERTLLAVDTHRVFIEVSDPALREELVAAYEEAGRDVIAASNSRTLLSFMDRLPLPRDLGDDIVIADDDFPGTNATDLHRHLLAHGWSIPVFTISPEAPFDSTRMAS